MRIGYPWWHTVTTDTAGVPRSQCFGDVDRLEPVLASMGLTLGWNQPSECFVILQRLGPTKWTCQLQLRKADGSPVLLCDKLIRLVRMAKEDFGIETADSIKDTLQRVRARHKYEMASRRQAQQDLKRKDLYRDLRPRPIINYARN